jgi:hypothetical protein
VGDDIVILTGRLASIPDILTDTGTTIPATLATLATAAKLLAYVQLLARSDAAIATDNATELTAINADGGSGAGDYANTNEALEAIRDRGDAAWATNALGAGAVAWTITVTKGGVPVDGVRVWATTDAAGSNILCSGYTNSSGVIVFNVDAGTYYLWKEKASVNFTNPETVAVS